MTHRIRPAIAGLIVALSATAALAQDEAPEEVAVDTVVAEINGTEITAGHLILLRAQLPEQLQQLPLDQLYDGLIQQAVSQALLSQSVEDVPQAAEMTLENQQRAVRANVVMQRIAEEVVTEAALEEAYAAEYGGREATPEYNASHILVETRDEAAALKAELDEGADFAALAREHSTGPSGVNGGNLGWFGPGMMVPSFEDAVADLSPDEVSQPVETQFGWHLVKLNDRREQAPPALDEVRDQLAQTLQQEAVQARLEELREAGNVLSRDVTDIDPGFLDNVDLLAD